MNGFAHCTRVVTSRIFYMTLCIALAENKSLEV
jgi:hypothetical protein